MRAPRRGGDRRGKGRREEKIRQGEKGGEERMEMSSGKGGEEKGKLQNPIPASGLRPESCTPVLYTTSAFIFKGK